MSARRLLVTLVLLGVIGAAGGDTSGRVGPPPIGRWDLTVRGPDGEYPSWLEVRKSGYTTLVGTFVGRFGSARPVGRIEFADGKLRFSVPPQWEKRPDDLTRGYVWFGDLGPVDDVLRVVSAMPYDEAQKYFRGPCGWIDPDMI